ncbi:MAG: ice-binding family protein [Actinomycetota bacterium]
MNDLIRRTIRTFLAKTRVFIIAVILIPIFSFFGIFSTTTAASTISLGTAGNFAILAGAGITSTGPANIGGDVGSYPTASITGIPWCNGCLAGTNHVGDLVTQTAKTDLQTAVNTLSTYATTNTVTSDLGGQTLGPGVYTGNTPIYFMSVNGTLTLDGGGDPNSLFIFKAVRLSTGSSGTQIKLINGANVCNVYWDLTTLLSLVQ